MAVTGNNPGVRLTPPSDKWLSLPEHVIEDDRCIYCGEKVEDRPFQSYEEMVENFFAFEFEGEPGHIHESREEWEYLTKACLG